MGDVVSEPFGTVNWVVCSVLLLASVFFGLYNGLKGRGNATTEDYLLGGRQMSTLPVALSMISTTISAISIVGLSSETYFYGSQYVIVLLGSLYSTILIQNLTIPILYRLDILTVTEYITLRFGSQGLRTLSSACMIVYFIIYSGICLYAPSLTLSTVTGLSTEYSIVIMGLLCSAYTAIGGVKAIVYTDAIQCILMFLGIMVAVVFCVLELGGVGNVFSIASDGERLEFFNLDPSPFVRYTFWSVQLQGIFIIISWVGVNQASYMRISSVQTLTIAKRLCSYYFIGLCVLWLTFFFAGIVAYAIYSDCDPLTSGKIDEPDMILPYMIVNKVSHITGIAGLFAAAVYSAMLSSASTYANASACLLWQDFLSKTKFFKYYPDEKVTMVLKILSAGVAISAIGFAMLVKLLGTILVVTNSISNAINGCRLGMFIAGMCAPWVNVKGAYAGFLASLIFNLWILAGQFITGLGAPEKLPLSIEGCPENLESLNSTSVSLLDYEIENQTFTSILAEDEAVEELVERSIYELSYCYNGVLGIIIYYTVASIVAIITGPLNPSAVDAKLISPRVLRAYKRLWRFFKGFPSKMNGTVLGKDNVFVVETDAQNIQPTETATLQKYSSNILN